MIATGRRNIRDGREYDKYFHLSDLKGKEVTLKEDGDTFDTIVLMKDLVLKNRHQVAKISALLEGKTREESCRNIWNWVYNHFQYKQDSSSAEQLRTPLRSWKDRKEGIDCDCMSILISTILCNLNIPHALRKTKYSGKDYFQHIYVVVPASGSSIQGNNYYTLDCVVDRFNYEVPFSAKHDLNMQINMLNGFRSLSHSGLSLAGLAGAVNAYPHSRCFCHEFNGLGALPGVDYTSDVLAAELLIRTKRHLENTLIELDANPNKLKNIGMDQGAFRKRLVLLLTNWENATMRDNILAELEAEEDRASGMGGFQLNGFFKSIGKAVKGAAKSVSKGVSKATRAVNTGVNNAAKWTSKTVTAGAKAVATGVKNAASWTADKAKDVVKAIIKYNPLTIAIRNGLLLAFKINLFRQAERLGYALWSDSEAQVKGLNMAEYAKLKSTYNKVVNVFTKMGGEKKNLDKALKDGWEHGTKKHGLLRGLGEPATAATTAAASGVLATITAWLSKIDFNALFAKLKNKPEYAGEDQAAYRAPGDGNSLPAGLVQEILAQGGQIFQAPAPANGRTTQYTMPAQQDPTGQYLPQSMQSSGGGMGSGAMIALAAAGIGAILLLRK